MSLTKLDFRDISLESKRGRVSAFVGTTVEVEGIEGRTGEYYNIQGGRLSTNLAEVVGFRQQKTILMPFGQIRGIRLNDRVVKSEKQASIKVSERLLGRCIDPFGSALDDKGAIDSKETFPLYPSPKNPLQKSIVSAELKTKVKAIDTFLNIGVGQRIGIFAGSGVGKTTLFTNLALNTESDVKVICLIGERGTEVKDVLTALKQSNQLERCVIVAATSEQPALTRVHALYSATAIAEYFCEQGKNVLLLADSVTRHAMAQREIGLAVGEPPTLRGYTPSVFAQLPSLIERVGSFHEVGKGSITGVYTVLVEGGDMDEPVADNMRAILDGHIVLSRELSDKQIYPAIDIMASRSRVRHNIIDKELDQISKGLYAILNDYKKVSDYLDITGHKAGENPKLDKTVELNQKLQDWLCSDSGNYSGDLVKLLEESITIK